MTKPIFVKVATYRLNLCHITDYYRKDKSLNINLISGVEINIEDPTGKLFYALDEAVSAFMLEN